MTQTALTTDSNITTVMTHAFDSARVCVTALEEDVLPVVAPDTGRAAARLLRHCQASTIFERGVLADLMELVEVMAAEIAAGTEMVTRYDYDPDNVSADTSYTQRQRTPEADRLAGALPLLLELCQLLNYVHDTLRAEAALKALRAAS